MSKREDILVASVRAIAQQGVRGLRVNDVAAEAGVATGSLYYHFKDRDGLLAAALEFVNERVLSSRRRQHSAGSSARATVISQLVAEFDDDVDVVENSRAWNELRASAVYEDALRQPMTEASQAWTADIRDGIAAAQAAGEIAPSVDADTVAAQLAILMEGLDGRWLTGELSTTQARSLLENAALHFLPLD